MFLFLHVMSYLTNATTKFTKPAKAIQVSEPRSILTHSSSIMYKQHKVSKNKRNKCPNYKIVIKKVIKSFIPPAPGRNRWKKYVKIRYTYI
jgi:hypothetical protein